MKKVYIATWYSSTNCGTCLQARALYDTIKKKYPVRMISYHRNYSFFSLNDFKIIVKKIINKIKNKLNTKNYIEFTIDDKRKEKIDKFTKQSFCLEEIPSGNNMEEFEKNARAFIVGSDQLWNPYWFEETYFLDFVKNKKKKMSYATSIGLSEIPLEYESIYKKRLNSFSHINVREEKAKNILTDILQRHDINVVCDPTLLLNSNEWRKIYSENKYDSKFKDYILCYFVGGIAGHEKELEEIKNKLRKKIVIIPMQNSDRNYHDAEYAEVGPYEFLQLIDQAQYVVTDSFHAIAISITFHKSFSVLERKKTQYGKSQRSRISEILSKYNLETCLYENSKLIMNDIDYDFVDKIVLSERNRSMNILDTMLSECID